MGNKVPNATERERGDVCNVRIVVLSLQHCPRAVLSPSRKAFLPKLQDKWKMCVCVCVVSFLFPFVKILIGSSFRWVELMQPFA